MSSGSIPRWSACPPDARRPPGTPRDTLRRVTRRRSSAPGRQYARALGTLLLLGSVLVAACAGPTATEPPGSSAPATATSEPTPTSEPATPDASEPTPTSEPATREPATEEPAAEPTEPGDGGSAGGDCTGTEENLAFYREFAQVAEWAVYCPVLPPGWFVGTGQWRQAEGGRLEISYRGPNGAGAMLQEGSFCPGDGDCVPPGEEVGPVPFADLEGTLVRTDDGWAVVVDRGEQPSWLLTITGVSEDAARAISADLVPVEG
jgi:hypothetical protein